MTANERRKYLHKMRLRYWAAQKKKERSRLLNESLAVFGLYRKSLIRLLNGELARKRRTLQQCQMCAAHRLGRTSGGTL